MKPATSVNVHSMTGSFESLKSCGVERTNRLDRSQALALCLSKELLRKTSYNRPISVPIHPLQSVTEVGVDTEMVMTALSKGRVGI